MNKLINNECKVGIRESFLLPVSTNNNINDEIKFASYKNHEQMLKLVEEVMMKNRTFTESQHYLSSLYLLTQKTY